MSAVADLLMLVVAGVIGALGFLTYFLTRKVDQKNKEIAELKVKETHEEAKKQVEGKSVQDLIDSNNARYSKRLGK